MDWDDLRVFLAVTETGSLSGAARRLSVNHSTVFRRINALEADLGVRLFDRHRDGYVPTPAGDDLRGAARRVRDEIEAADRRVTGRDLQLRGAVVVTTTDTLAYRVLGPHLAAFHAAYPAINVAVNLDTQYLNLSRRQADVAIRPTLAPPDQLIGRRICDIGFSIYGAPAYLAVHGADRPLADHTWLGFDESLGHVEAAKWMRNDLAEARVALTSNNLLGHLGAAAAGMGLAVLPCFLGDPEPALVRVAGLPDTVRTELWLLTHADLRRTARIRAFLDFMADSLAADRAALEGAGSA